MEQKIFFSNSASGLNSKIKEMQEQGWECVGSHTAVVVHSQNRYAGMQHMDTRHEAEYAQTMKKS